MCQHASTALCTGVRGSVPSRSGAWVWCESPCLSCWVCATRCLTRMLHSGLTQSWLLALLREVRPCMQPSLLRERLQKRRVRRGQAGALGGGGSAAAGPGARARRAARDRGPRPPQLRRRGRAGPRGGERAGGRRAALPARGRLRARAPARLMQRRYVWEPAASWDRMHDSGPICSRQSV